MPLVAAAVCPHPPMLVPEVAAGAAAELDELRAACDAAVAQLLDAEPSTLVLVGGAPASREYAFPFRFSLAPWGVPVEYTIGDPDQTSPTVPLSVGIGLWLLRRAIDAGRVRRPTTWRIQTVGTAKSRDECARLSVMGFAHPWAMLVMGDGSACRGQMAPGYEDPRAEHFDKAVAAALATADTESLLALDAALAEELMCTGRPAWQVLAGAVEATAPPSTVGPWTAELHYDGAPYGVGYFVATWTAPSRRS